MEGSGEGSGRVVLLLAGASDGRAGASGRVTAGHSSEDEADVMGALARLTLTAPDAELRRAAGEALAREYLSNHERT